MTLNFPNGSRSYDAKRNLIRFWGYDSALEISFFLEVSALCKLNPQTRNVEARMPSTGMLPSLSEAKSRVRSFRRV